MPDIADVASVIFYNFLCYVAIGLSMAVLPVFVHGTLGFSPVIAGCAIGLQYVGTFLSRSSAGRTADSVGPKKAVLLGLSAVVLNGIFMLVAAFTAASPWVSLVLVLLGRLSLGLAESWTSMSTIMWSIGRIGAARTGLVISLNGVASYAGLAFGAPAGALIVEQTGFAGVALTVVLLGTLGMALALPRAPVKAVAGERLPFRRVLRRVSPFGFALAMGSSGFGTIAAFITLYYQSRGWHHAALALTVFGLFFVATRLSFTSLIDRFGPHRVSVMCLSVECAGLVVLACAGSPEAAIWGAAITGAGFTLLYPALAVEAVRTVSPANRGAALGAYSLFLDLSLAVSGPLTGALLRSTGYSGVFLASALACVFGVVLVAMLRRNAEAIVLS